MKIYWFYPRLPFCIATYIFTLVLDNLLEQIDLVSLVLLIQAKDRSILDLKDNPLYVFRYIKPHIDSIKVSEYIYTCSTYMYLKNYSSQTPMKRPLLLGQLLKSRNYCQSVNK